MQFSSLRVWGLVFISQALFVPSILGISSVSSYSDASCQSLFASTVGTDDGVCHQLPPRAGSLEVPPNCYTCAVTVYTDTFCSNDTTLLTEGTCITGSQFHSFSVDCQSGAPTGGSACTTTAASESPLGLGLGTVLSYSQVVTLPTSTQSVTSTQQVATSEDSTSSNVPQQSQLSTTLGTTSFSLTTTSDTSSQSITTSSGAPASSGGGENGEISIGGQIALGVVLPLTAIIVAIIFGINGWKRRGKLNP